MVRLRLFAGARAAAGTARDELPGRTVAQVLDGAVRRYGHEFQEVLSVSRVWVNGEPAAQEDEVSDGDEVAVLPPVSGGATALSSDGETPPAPPVSVEEDPVLVDEPELVVEPEPEPEVVEPEPELVAVAVGGSSAAAAVAVAVAVSEPVRSAQPDRRPRPAPPRPRPLRPVPPAVPHGRLGAIWGLFTAGAVLGGRWAFAAWVALGGIVALLALARTRSIKPVAVPGTALAVLAAPLLAVVDGWAGMAAMAAGVVIDLLLRRGPDVSQWLSLRDARNLVTAAGAVVGLEGISLVRLDARSLTMIGVLLALVCLHDASRYLVGWGAPSVWEGRVAGIAAVGSATLALAVVDPSPLSGAYPWLVGALVAGSGLLGTRVVRRLEGDEAVGPLRRLDTLLLAAPAVVLTAIAAGLG